MAEETEISVSTADELITDEQLQDKSKGQLIKK
ncbi:MAG: phosphoserine phosphatase, partial [Halanaeroarchaeum sp.]